MAPKFIENLDLDQCLGIADTSYWYPAIHTLLSCGLYDTHQFVEATVSFPFCKVVLYSPTPQKDLSVTNIPSSVRRIFQSIVHSYDNELLIIGVWSGVRLGESLPQFMPECKEKEAFLRFDKWFASKPLSPIVRVRRHDMDGGQWFAICEQDTMFQVEVDSIVEECGMELCANHMYRLKSEAATTTLPTIPSQEPKVREQSFPELLAHAYFLLQDASGSERRFVRLTCSDAEDMDPLQSDDTTAVLAKCRDISKLQKCVRFMQLMNDQTLRETGDDKDVKDVVVLKARIAHLNKELDAAKFYKAALLDNKSSFRCDDYVKLCDVLAFLRKLKELQEQSK